MLPVKRGGKSMTATNSTASAELSARLRKAMHDHWSLFLVEGIILTLLGLEAIIVPPLGGLFVTVFLGWLFLIAGIVGLIATLRAGRPPDLDGRSFRRLSR
jgi:uncharacterized membrane protein HdeD (DUF308 family)